MAPYKGLNLVVQEFDSEHRGFYEEAKQHRLVVQRCGSCGMLRGAIGAACPFCTSLEWTWHPVSGNGEIYSYQIVTQAVQPAFRDWVPYPIVLVELDEQRARAVARRRRGRDGLGAGRRQPGQPLRPDGPRSGGERGVSGSGSRSASSTWMTPWRFRSSG